MGSTLPKLDSGVVWKAGEIVNDVRWSVRANHGGGWQFRLCPAHETLDEACFQRTPVPFAGDSKMMMSNGSMLPLKSTFVTEGTMPAGSTWQMLPIVRATQPPTTHLTLALPTSPAQSAADDARRPRPPRHGLSVPA